MRSELKKILLTWWVLSLVGCGSLVHHKVQKGDTLYSIGWRYGQEADQIAQWNNLRSPYMIHQGQVLRIAPPLERSIQTTPKAAPTQRQRASVVLEPPADKPLPKISAGPVVWGWPAEGKLIATFSAKNLDNKGVDISAKRGTPVRAAARGKVVYSGSGLTGYGNLLIIKHNESYLSAYAHNDTLLVKEGEAVKLGQKVAAMGDTGSDRVMLHFEIRYNGKPVNPQHYLPKR